MELRENGLIEIKKKNNHGAFLHWSVFLLLLAMVGLTSFYSGKAYYNEKGGNAVLEASEFVEKGDTIKINFTSEMLKDSIEDGVMIEPDVKAEKWWQDEKTFCLKINDSLRPESQYKIKISGVKTKWLIPQKDLEFSFNSALPPKLNQVYPENGQTEVDQIESIKMSFDKPISDDYRVEISINPMTGFDYVLDETQKELVIVPREKLSDLTQYKIKVDLLSRKYSEFRKTLYEGNFTTRKPTEVAYSFDENGDPLKTEERKEDVEPQIKEGRYIDIDLSSQTLFIFEDGKEKGAFKVSTGKRGMNTPEGTFKVRLKAQRPWSKKYGLYMPWFIGFTSLGHGIHELPEWPGGYKEGANHLGTPVSHGCVRLGIGPAKTVYDFVSVGDPIVIHQ